MIKKIHIKNFKSLKDTGEIELKTLNVLSGVNGMGKSSFLQTLLLLRQSESIHNGILNLKGSLVKLGIATDVLFQKALTEEIILSFSTDNDTFTWNFNALKMGDELPAQQHYPKESLHKISLFSDKFQYITANRVAQEEYHNSSENSIRKGFIGTKGEYAVHFIYATQTGEIKYEVPEHLRHPDWADSNNLTTQTEAWLNQISPNAKLVINKISSDLFQLGFSFGQSQTQPFKPINVGFGLSYTLSVLVALLTSSSDSLIIIENPEAHLHPQAQAFLSDLIVKAARNGAQIIVETHSDHIINGIRVATRQFYDDTQNNIEEYQRRGISSEQIRILWFERQIEGDEDDSSVNITPIQIEPNAKIKNAPQGFFDQINIDLKKILGFLS